ncbi:MAG: 4Fe-4S dicluster domain-containing protein [Treponema sp.]|jgi:ferredoxin|nr:4Fe-4S dicluster domain-containing protein [Treponema sp.]
MTDTALFYRVFKVPEVAYPVIDAIVSPLEQRLICLLNKGRFTVDDVEQAFWDIEGSSRSGESARDFAGRAYRRGIFSLVIPETGEAGPDRYTLSDFYGRLDVFVVTEQERYRSFDPERRHALDEWYFNAYCARLNPDPAVSPTEDAVLPLAEVLARIEQDPRQLYLSPCDCRSLSGNCGKPQLTCLSYRGGPNTFAGRGIAKPVSREEGKRVVMEAERAGLMHTAGPMAICNCCGDCCYLFRAGKRRSSMPRWPLILWIIALAEERCVRCGQCVRRCHFGALAMKASRGRKNVISLDQERCAGCGICVSACPSGALSVRRRDPPSGREGASGDSVRI